MTQIKVRLGFAAVLGLAAFAAAAGTTPPPAGAATSPSAVEKRAEPKPESRGPNLTWGRHEQDGAPKSSRLRFRSADGTCSCTCARGGINEEEIGKAQQVREKAQS